MRAFASLLLASALATTTLTALPAFAQDDAAAAATTTEAQATQLVTDVGNRAVAILQGGGGTAAVQSKLEPLFNEVVDLDWIAKFVMGRNWRTLTPDQQQKYLTAYRTFLVKHYVSNFTEYTQGTQSKVIRTTPQARGTQLVSTQILRPGKAPVNIDYRVRGTKVTDIAVEGVSLITTQREEFASVMQRQGFDYLLQQLQSKTAAAASKAANGVGSAANTTDSSSPSVTQ